MIEMNGRARRLRARAWFAGGLWLLACGAAGAEIVQGRLLLQWGDPTPAAAARHEPAQLLATLVTDTGARVALDPAQARRAAGDLYTLANRRVAVEFASADRGVLLQPVAEAIVSAERVWDRAPAIGSAGQVAVASAVSGNTRWVTLMCKFSDLADEQKTLAFFTSQYGTEPGQLGHYWAEVSYGQIDLAGSRAHGWMTLPKARGTYVTTVDGEDSADLDALFQDCTAAADATVDFTGVQGINMMFNGDLDGYAWGGGACAVLDGTQRCLSVTWNPPWSFGNLAPLAHEMGHGYGLPHSDNSDGDADPYDNPWDVMSDAWSNAVYDATYGARPKHVNMAQRARLGWLDGARARLVPPGDIAPQRIMLDYASLKVAANPQLVVLAMPIQADPYATEVYTLEARRRSGDYESALAGDAVIIHQIKDYGTAYSVDADVPPADYANNEGSMFKPGESWRSPDGSRRVRVESATATGFVVVITPRPRLTGGRLPALRKAAAATRPVAAGAAAGPMRAGASPAR